MIQNFKSIVKKQMQLRKKYIISIIIGLLVNSFSFVFRTLFENLKFFFWGGGGRGAPNFVMNPLKIFTNI